MAAANQAMVTSLPCSVCGQVFQFKVEPPSAVYKSLMSDNAGKPAVQYYTETCRNNRQDNNNQPCNTVYRIKYNHSTNTVEDYYKSPTPDGDTFWLGIGRELIKGNLDVLDKRAEYMITTITALIVVDFGLLLGFQVPSGTWKLAPQFFLAISMIFFFSSLRIKKYEILPQSPENIMKKYDEIGKSKYSRQDWGYIIFIIALFAMAITYVVDSPFNTIPERPEDPTQIQLNGTLTVSPP